MFCPECGKEISEESIFCMICGCNVKKYLEKGNIMADINPLNEDACEDNEVVPENNLEAIEDETDKGEVAAIRAKDALIKAIDQDGNGIIDSVDLILMALKVPGVKIRRDEFLRKEFFKYCSSDVIEKAIEMNPAKAGIDEKLIDKIADDVIKFERNAVSGISLALGMPGGVAMVATIPADIAQYYGYMLRAAQKMLYLYGFPELDIEDVNLDSETINSLTLCLGIMFGVANANNAIKAMAKALAVGVEKQLLKKALTKGTIYPIVKSIAKWFSIKMTKEVFAGFFKKAIPVVGGIVGGGITFATFKPCCYRLKNALNDTILSNPNHKETMEEKKIYEDIQSGVVEVYPEELTEIENEDFTVEEILDAEGDSVEIE